MSTFSSVLFFTLLLFLCPTTVSSKTNRTIRLMTFNTWNSGGNVYNGMAKIAKHILTVNPDIAAIIEVQYANSLPDLLNLLGPDWSGKFYNTSHPDTGIITRHRIIPTNETTFEKLRDNGGTRAKIAIDFGQQSIVVNVWAIHLAYQMFGPEAACNKLVTDPVQLDAAEAYLGGNVPGRIQNMHTIITDVYFQKDMAASRQEPMFVMGDFNCPSPLDWVPSTANFHCGWVYAWPATKQLLLNNFVDAFRYVNPDPLEVPGNTWSTVTKYVDGWQGIVPEPQDRIDMIYYKTPKWRAYHADVYDGTEPIVPAPNYYFNDWPSDHASVYADLIHISS